MSVLESQSWYRVARLRPTLRRHVQVRRHHYRGAPWFVLEDAASGRQHRLDECSHAFIAMCDGQRTVAQVWQRISEQLGDDAPTQDHCISLLGQLHGADLLICDVPPDTREIFARYAEQKRAKRWQALRSPFFVRLPLLDPERLLGRIQGLGRWLFSRVSLALWLLLVVAGLMAALMHWSELATDAKLGLLSPLNLLALWLVYPLVKALHELGHALAVKRWGGEVHDTGVMLLVFMPVPYVDASSANAFEDKRARMTVAAAGIAVELALAALAMFVWLTVEPGVVRMLALDVMMIGGISTVLFNGNPLLKFDGYYVLADAIEIPNLAGRAARYWGYLSRRFLLGIADSVSPARTRGERGWFLFYGLAAFVYRTFILIAILLFVAGVSKLAAAVLGTWAVVGQVVLPTVKKLKALAADPQVRARRPRAIAVALAGCAAVTLILLVPAPHRTLAQGVVWSGDDTRVRAGADCFVERVLVAPGVQVDTGTPLIECTDPLQDARIAVLAAQLQELQARHTRERSRDQAQAQIVAEEIVATRTRLDDAVQRADQLLVRSPANGVFHMPAAVDLPGRFIAQGETFGEVIDGQRLGVRLTVRQHQIGLIRNDVRRVLVALPEQPGRVLEASVARVLPGATTALPSAALGTAGGGRIIADPIDETGHSALEPHFLVDLEFAQAGVAQMAGARVNVRFSHGPQALGRQWYGQLRRMLLRRLAV